MRMVSPVYDNRVMRMVSPVYDNRVMRMVMVGVRQRAHRLDLDLHPGADLAFI